MPHVYCAKNSTDGIPKIWKSNTMKANARCFTVVLAITECWHTIFRHVRYVKFGESLQKHSKSIANRGVEDWEASIGHTKDTTPLFHGPWHNPVGEHIRAQLFRMWNRLRFHRSHKYFRDAKAMQINRILKISWIWHVKLNRPSKQ